jgi:hypothetical protein
LPLDENKNLKFKKSVDSVETEIQDNKTNRKVLYVIGGLVIIGGILFGLGYFDVFNSSGSTPGSRPGPGPAEASSPTVETINLDRALAERATEQANTNPIVITKKDNQTRNPVASTSSNNAVAEMNQRMREFNASSSNPSASSSNSPLPTYNRYDVLDKLKENEGPFSRPGSPIGSTDSSETIRPYSSSKAKNFVQAVRNSRK